MDDVVIRGAVVAAPEVSGHEPLALGVALIEIVDELREVGVLGEWARILKAVPEPPLYVVNMYAVERAPEVEDDFDRALARADNGDGTDVAAPALPGREITGEVDDPLAQEAGELFGYQRRSSRRKRYRAGLVDQAAVGHDFDYAAAGGPRFARQPERDDIRRIPDPTVELPGHPADVGRVVLAQDKGNAEIEEIEQPALAFEETKEAVSAPWFPRRDEIAQRMMLYVGPVEEHLRLPAWSGLPFEKQHGPGPAHLLQRDGEADIGR